MLLWLWGLTEGCRHGWVLHDGLAVSAGQVWSGEVAALFVVVLDIEAGEFGKADPQSAAAVIDVLSIQRLKHPTLELVINDRKQLTTLQENMFTDMYYSVGGVTTRGRYSPV